MNRHLLIKRVFVRYLSHHFTRISKQTMAKLVVRSSPNQEFVSLNFNYGLEGASPKTFQFNRQKSEEIQVVIERMKKNIQTKLCRKKKKKPKPDQEDTNESSDVIDISVYFEVKGCKLDGDNCLGEILLPNAVLYVGDKKYDIDVNPPTVNSLKLPRHIMQGFPLYPQIDIEHADLNDTEFVWHSIDGTVKARIGDGLSYVPTLDDVGKKLLLKCVPKHGERIGEEVSMETKDIVGAGPGVCPFENRHAFTQETSKPGWY